jgi:outer membrane lipoprotein-sorting protein
MKLFFLNILLLLSFLSFGQSLGSKLNESEKRKMESTIKQKSKELKSLDCKFSQERISSLLSQITKATGTLKYKDNTKLRWEYSSPFSFSLIINNEEFIMLNSKKEKIKSDMIQKQLGNFIMNSINGSFITSGKDFKAEYYKSKNVINVKLIPINKQIKQMFKYLVIELDPANYVANSVKMTEQSDDETIIVFSDKKINSTISDSFFNVK